MSFKTLDQLPATGKRVLVRVDLNVPMENGHVTDGTRLDRILPTLRDITGKGGKVILLAHFGRPKGETFEERANPAESLKPVADELARRLGKPIAFAANCIGEVAEKASFT